MGGSYFVEALTDEIEKAANEYIQKIDAMGGSVAAIEEGYIQQEIAAASYRYQLAVERNEQIVVGVNQYTEEEKPLGKTFRVDDSIRVSQSEKLKKLREKRNNIEVMKALSALKQAAIDGSNLMPSIIYAVEQYATLGEISDVMREVFGEYQG
jgi:methylmalonyl-CoA mutase N-terminal domain/subunit